MTVVSSTPDAASRSLTIVADLAAPPPLVWELWADPRRLERWWGPPTWPATFTRHDPVPGGESRYHMTGPDGERVHGWWRFLALEEPRWLEFEDGFADERGTPDAQMPTTSVRVELVPAGEGSRMTITSRFATAEQMEQLLAMGVVEGMTAAVGQVDDLLTAA